MTHRGRITNLMPGDTLTVNNPVSGTTTTQVWAISQHCNYCNQLWGSHEAPPPCEPWCLNCGMAIRQHAGVHCLFAPTDYAPVPVVFAFGGS